jgi:hypothetical protein
LRTGYYILRNRMAIGSVPVGMAYFLSGVVLGIVYRVVRPPRLRLPSPALRLPVQSQLG